MTRSGFALAALLILAGCSGGEERDRPPWADGQVVVTERPERAGQDLRNLAARIVALHNRERVAVGATPLAWDEMLASAAASYGPALAARGRLAHSPSGSRPGQGENLWMGTAGAFSIEEMIGSWAAEKSVFVPGAVPNVSRSGHFGDVGHYTQMIWRTTTRVGCALHRGRANDFLICRYAPPGNVVGGAVP
ncbi:MAG TPA: CAP domain-containing protein [Allosphingosinicella sp.]